MRNTVYITKENMERLFYNTPQIVFEVTEKCNLCCKYCFYGDLYKNKVFRNNQDMMQETADLLLELYKKYWAKNPSFYINQNIDIGFYGGEPLLNIRLIKHIITYIDERILSRENDRKISYSMTTNALLLDKYMDYIVDKGIKLTISLDGDEYGTSHRILPNGRNAYKEIVKNIEKLITKYPLFFRDNVEFNSVLHDRNTYSGIYDYFKKWGKVPTLSTLNDFGFASESQQMLQSSMYSNNDKMPEYVEIKKWHNTPEYNQAYSYLLTNSPHVYSDYNELMYGKNIKRKLSIPTGTCQPFSKKVFVTAMGLIFPCEYIGFDYPLGEISSYKGGIDFECMTQNYNDKLNNCKHKCKGCSEKLKCTACMYSSGILKKGEICQNFTKKEQDYTENAVKIFFRKHPSLYKEMMLHTQMAER